MTQRSQQFRGLLCPHWDKDHLALPALRVLVCQVLPTGKQVLRHSACEDLAWPQGPSVLLALLWWLLSRDSVSCPTHRSDCCSLSPLQYGPTRDCAQNPCPETFSGPLGVYGINSNGFKIALKTLHHFFSTLNFPAFSLITTSHACHS